MKAVIQRVKGAQVSVSDSIVGCIEQGLLVYIAFQETDQPHKIDSFIEKILDLRIFPNEHGKFDFSVRDIGGEILLISQFTLLADCSKGRRPNFSGSAKIKEALFLYNYTVELLKKQQLRCAFGQFQADMQVMSTNDGPVTIILDQT